MPEKVQFSTSCITCPQVYEKLWKVFRLAYRLGCVIGFTVQVGMFIRIYLEYPTRTQTSSTSIMGTNGPAMTICKNSWSINVVDYRRRKVVGRNPLCIGTKFSLVLKCVYIGLPTEVLLKEAYHSDKLLRECKTNLSCNSSESWLYVADHGICFAFNSNYSKSYQPAAIIDNKEAYEFTTRYVENEAYMDGDDDLLISIHDEHSMTNMGNINPKTITPGIDYDIRLKKTTWNYLPPPFDTRCRDYTFEFESNGREGPASESVSDSILPCPNETLIELCVNLCVMDNLVELSTEDDKCFNILDIPANWPILSENFENKCKKFLKPAALNVFQDLRKNCTALCPKDCNYETYEMDVRKKLSLKPQRIFAGRGRPAKKIYLNGTVKIGFSTLESITVSLVQQYTDLELFGIIGGYMGIWMGMSFLNGIQLCKDFIFFLLQKNKWANAKVKRPGLNRRRLERQQYFNKRTLRLKLLFISGNHN